MTCFSLERESAREREREIAFIYIKEGLVKNKKQPSKNTWHQKLTEPTPLIRLRPISQMGHDGLSGIQYPKWDIN